MFTEQILGVIYQTLQAAHQEPHSDEAKIRTVNLICDVAASFFSSVKVRTITGFTFISIGSSNSTV